MNPYRRYRIRYWIRISIAAAAGLLLATAIGLVIEVATGPHPAPDYKPPPMPTPPWAPGASSSPPATATVPALTGTLQLIQGRDLVNGVRLGYPHSTEGAVSAAAEFMTDIGSTLDPDRAAAILRMTADPAYPQGPQQFAQGVLIEMRASRLEDRGAVPIEPEPRQLVELALGHARAYARDVDVLDAHCVCAVCLSCPQPGEQRSARIPQMQLARGARSESSALVHRLTAHIAQEKHEHGCSVDTAGGHAARRG